MNKFFAVGTVLLFFLSNANAVDIGIGAKVGTAGAGFDFSVGLTKTINARLSLTSFDIDGQEETLTVGDDGAEGDVEAELDLDYGATALFIDWHVFDGTFHVTAGLFKNNGKAKMTGELQESVIIDGQQLDVADIAGGEVSGSISLGDSYQPYLGVGWGRKAGEESGLSVTVDLGVAMLDPEVELEADLNVGSVNFTDQADLNQTLRDAESDAEDEFDDFKLFPLISIGINYAF